MNVAEVCFHRTERIEQYHSQPSLLLTNLINNEVSSNWKTEEYEGRIIVGIVTKDDGSVKRTHSQQ